MDHFSFNYAPILESSNSVVSEPNAPQPQPPPLPPPIPNNLNTLPSSPPTQSTLTTSALQSSGCILSVNELAPVTSSAIVSPIVSISYSNSLGRNSNASDYNNAHFYNNTNINNLIEEQKKNYKEFTEKFNYITEHVNSFLQLLDRLVCQQSDLNLQFTTAFEYMSKDYTRHNYDSNNYYQPYNIHQRRQNDVKNVMGLSSNLRGYPLVSHSQPSSTITRSQTSPSPQIQQHHQQHQRQNLLEEQKNGKIYNILIL